MNYSKGISWIDDCRIPFVDGGYNYKNGARGNTFSIGQEPDGKRTEPVKNNDKGRFPANLLCSDDILNDGIISKGKVGMTQQSSGGKIFVIRSKGDTKINDGLSDQGTNSRYYDIDKWFDQLLNKQI